MLRSLDPRFFPLEEAERWSHLRAIEWSNFGIFLLPLYCGALIVSVGWGTAAAILAGANLLWVFGLRTRLPLSVSLSNVAALAVTWLQWPVSIGVAVTVFLVRHDIVMGIALILVPFGVGVFAGGLIEFPIWWLFGKIDPKGRAQAQASGGIGTFQRRLLNASGWVVSDPA